MTLKPLLPLLAAVCAFAQSDARIAWSAGAEPSAAASGSAIFVRATARLAPGWHLYSASSPAGLPATFQVQPGTLVRVLQPPPVRAFDKNLNEDSETYEGEVAFLLEVKLPEELPAGASPLDVRGRYQICSDKECVPGRWSASVPLTIDPTAQTAIAIPAGYAEARPEPARAADASAPVSTSLDQSWAAFVLVAFGFGLAAIFTPCVFPMIPLTMSYFLNRKSGGRRDAVIQAAVFCLGIVALFTGLGLLATAILGPFGMAQLGSNPWVNAFIAALFTAFGLSLLGAFEITIPSSLLTRLNKSSGRGGFAGTLLMGLTFSLASFACVGPFVGTLLAASVSGGPARPVVGMAAFSSGLALPFFALAIFPSYLKRMPKSGGWMVRVKVVLGFVILAAALKYLSSVDQVMQWGMLTRERFLAGWIVLFSLAGIYLLGFLRMDGIEPGDRVGLPRLFAGAAFLVFAISLVPGMFGGRLGDLDAFVPEPSARTAGLSGGSQGATLAWMKNDYRGALEKARAENKLVFVSFTGYACTNCHWMKANMFTRPEVEAALRDFVLVELYTDGTDAASEANAQLQLARFQTAAIPLYAIMDPDERVLTTSAGVTRETATYLAFLRQQRPQAPAGPDLANIKALDGKPLDAASVAGKVVVVNFWATWCAPCVQEIPGFNELHKEYAPRGVSVIGVSMDEEGRAAVDPFLKKHPIEYAVALGADEHTAKYGLEALPVTLVFDRSGKQVKRFDGFAREEALKEAVQQAL